MANYESSDWSLTNRFCWRRLDLSSIHLLVRSRLWHHIDNLEKWLTQNAAYACAVQCTRVFQLRGLGPRLIAPWERDNTWTCMRHETHRRDKPWNGRSKILRIHVKADSDCERQSSAQHKSKWHVSFMLQIDSAPAKTQFLLLLLQLLWPQSRPPRKWPCTIKMSFSLFLFLLPPRWAKQKREVRDFQEETLKHKTKSIQNSAKKKGD